MFANTTLQSLCIHMVHIIQSGSPVFGEELLISFASMIQPVGHSKRVLISLYKFSHKDHPWACLLNGRQALIATCAYVTALATNNLTHPALALTWSRRSDLSQEHHLLRIMRDENPMVRWPFLWFLLLSAESQGHGYGS